MRKLYACTTLMLTTQIAPGKPVPGGRHFDDSYIIVERGQQLDKRALDLLDTKDITDILARGQISETPPEPLIVDEGWQDIPSPTYPIDDAAAA